MTRLVLEMDLKKDHQMDLFLRAISEPKLRRTVAQGKDLAPEVAQLTQLADDKAFLKLSKATVATYQKFILRKVGHADVEKQGKTLLAYMESSYPDALRALKRYGVASRRQLTRTNPMRPPEITVRIDGGGGGGGVAANVYAVVNAAVYANVAVATFVAVAVGAVVIAAAFVV